MPIDWKLFWTLIAVSAFLGLMAFWFKLKSNDR